jgi:hypothetical protein
MMQNRRTGVFNCLANPANRDVRTSKDNQRRRLSGRVVADGKFRLQQLFTENPRRGLELVDAEGPEDYREKQRKCKKFG